MRQTKDLHIVISNSWGWDVVGVANEYVSPCITSIDDGCYSNGMCLDKHRMRESNIIYISVFKPADDMNVNSTYYDERCDDGDYEFSLYTEIYCQDKVDKVILTMNLVVCLLMTLLCV